MRKRSAADETAHAVGDEVDGSIGKIRLEPCGEALAQVGDRFAPIVGVKICFVPRGLERHFQRSIHIIEHALDTGRTVFASVGESKFGDASRGQGEQVQPDVAILVAE